MNLILRQVIGYQQGLKKASTSASPLLKKQLENTQQQLNQILTKWKFGDTPIKTSQEFLNNFEPWINRQLEQQKEWKVFLAKKGVSSLEEANTQLTNRDLSENEELTQLREELNQKDQELKGKVKEFQDSNGELLKRIEELEKNQATKELQQELTNLRKELARQEQTFQNTEQDYLARIEELLRTKSTGEDKEDYEELITERDQLTRAKGELEQELLALNNRLNLKQQEVNNKETSLAKLQKEKGELDKNLNKKLTEKNSLITTLNQEIKQHKEKYSKQGKLLDTEQLEAKKLEEKVEALETEIQQLKGAK